LRRLVAVFLGLSLLLAPLTVNAETQTSPTGDQIVNIAMSLRGKVQYAHAFDPGKLIFDCSGFTWYVYKQAGIDLGTIDDDKQALLGQYVPKSELQKGDLVFFWNSSSTSKTDVGHAGIYIGDGKYIHNANSTYDVIVSNLYGTYATEHYITARRILTNTDTTIPPSTGNTTPSTPPAGDSTTGQVSDLAQKIVDFAISLKGKVSWVSTYDPVNLRFTSSGYTYYVFQKFGIDLRSRTSATQALQGKEVAKTELKKGDLVFFKNSTSTIGHVGIYIGEGKYINNANAVSDVVISDFNSSYARQRFVTARRVIPE
jgi:cell wall-associated NlpC family hydrolase